MNPIQTQLAAMQDNPKASFTEDFNSWEQQCFLIAIHGMKTWKKFKL
jgi:hypothetical protein